MIKAFERAGKYNPANENHPPFGGQQGYYPVLPYSSAVIEQQINYIRVCRQQARKPGTGGICGFGS